MIDRKNRYNPIDKSTLFLYDSQQLHKPFKQDNKAD